MRTSDPFQALLAQLQRPGGGSQPADLAKVLEQLLQLLDTLPAGPHALDSLKKRGAWESAPLNSSTPEEIYWCEPGKFEFEHMSTEELKNLKAVQTSDGATVTVGFQLQS